MDGALEAIADYVDLKSPRTAGNKCAHRYRYASVANGRFEPMIASGVELTRCLQISRQLNSAPDFGFPYIRKASIECC